MKKLITLVFTLVTVSLSLTAMAHGDLSKPKHGGVVAKAEPLEAELVASADKVTLYITDHGKAVDTKGGSAKLTVLAGGKKSELTLAPTGDNKLEATITEPLAKGARVVGVVTAGGNKALSMRWAMK